MASSVQVRRAWRMRRGVYRPHLNRVATSGTKGIGATLHGYFIETVDNKERRKVVNALPGWNPPPLHGDDSCGYGFPGTTRTVFGQMVSTVRTSRTPAFVRIHILMAAGACSTRTTKGTQQQSGTTELLHQSPATWFSLFYLSFCYNVFLPRPFFLGSLSHRRVTMARASLSFNRPVTMRWQS